MKFTEDNIIRAGLRPTKNGTYSKPSGSATYYYQESCTVCGHPYLAQKRKGKFDLTCGHECGQQTLRKKRPKEVGEKISKGKRRDCLLELAYAFPVRRNKKEPSLLETRCSYCNRWFIPDTKQVSNVRRAFDGKRGGSDKFYCRDSCKDQCPVYYRNLWPKGFKPATSREVQPELRQLVFERDEWTCQLCGSEDSLQCHHFTGIRHDPLLSADVDNCITLCESCHKFVHKQPGCTYHDLRCAA